MNTKEQDRAVEMNQATINVCGDVLTVMWDGNVWVSPANGQQHSTVRAAMRAELAHYLVASGERIPSYDDLGSTYEAMLDGLRRA